MSYHYLAELVGGSSAPLSSDGEPLRRSKSTRTAERCYLDANWTGCYQCSLSGMMPEPSTEPNGRGDVTLYLLGFPVSPSASLASKQPKTTRATCGPIPPEYLARYSLDSRSWRTFQGSLLKGMGISGESLPTLPRSGSMQYGIVSQLPASAPLTKETDSLSWPTPTVFGNYNRKGLSKTSGDGLATAVKNRGSSGGPLNPTWVEWLMGWPLEWTGLKPLAMDRYRQWLSAHGIT